MHKHGLNVSETNKKYRLMNKCQEIKHTLSVELKNNLYVDDFKVDEDDVISIERKEFEEMAADLILRAKHLIVEIIVKDDDLDVGESHASVSSTEANPENYLLKDEQRNTRQLFS
uniref:Uncharacterized protein n=1 Tax=Panagrolaimus sp. PS1159 TaxID=55785 RepID=A0AC35GPH4_9BILA